MVGKPVDSSMIRSVGYDAKSRTLEMEFQTGAVYQYFDVPASVHKGLLAAASKGKYFNNEIRDCYECAQVAAKRRGAR